MYILISVTRKALEICESFYPTRDEAYQAMLEDILVSTRYTSVDEIRRDAEKGKCGLTDEDAWAATINEGTCQWKIVELPKENAPVSFYKRFLIENIESCQPYVITVGCSKANSSDMLENMLRLAIARYAKRTGVKEDITWSHFCAAIAGEDAFKDVCRKMGLTVEIDEGEPGLYDDETVFDKDRTVIVKDIKWNLEGDNPDWFIPAETILQAENEEKIADILEAEYGYSVVSYSVENNEPNETTDKSKPNEELTEISMFLNKEIDMEKIIDSMQLDSGQIIASMRIGNVEASLEVQGDVRVKWCDDPDDPENGKWYRHPSEFPEELKKLIAEWHTDHGVWTEDPRVVIEMNNWFELFISEDGTSYDSTLVDASNKTPGEIFSLLYKAIKRHNK